MALKRRTRSEDISRIVRLRRWGGGLRREHLAELLRSDVNSPEFKTSLMIAYRQRQIDFCGQFVVATVSPQSERKAA